MHGTFTTNTPVKTNQLQRATFILEVLSERSSSIILEALMERPGATFLELLIHTRASSEKLEVQLEKLCDTGVVRREEVEWESRFSVDEKRLSHILSCVRELPTDGSP